MIATDTIQTITLSNGKAILLNEQQVAALASMRAWIDSPTELFFTLSGYAGTGKTTITKELVRCYKADKRYQYNGIAVSAPTHKAKKVIHRATKEQAATIQKLLGLRPNTELDDFDINNPQFDAKADKKIKGLALLIIDEASMLNSDLFDMIIKEACDCRTKVLFMGDSAQLPPVKESISKIFTNVPSSVELTKVERQAGSNPLMGVYDLIRSDIKTEIDLFSHESATNAEGEGITFHNERASFERDILPLFCSDNYKTDPDFIKLITYTNASVAAWNGLIRKHLHNSPKLPIIPGDVLFAYNTCSLERDTPLIENSSDYVVESVTEDSSIYAVDIYKAILRSVDENRVSHVSIVRASGVETFLGCFNAKWRAAVNAKGFRRKYLWKEYFDFKNQHLLLSDIFDGQGKLLVKKDIDYGYAITVHKSQGSTFTNVAISENDIDRNPNNEDRNKLKYVAFSRPTRRAIVFTNRK